MNPSYLDPRSGEIFPLETPRWCGTNQAPLLLTPMPGIARGEIDSFTRSLWRYRAAFPFAPKNPITMGEGCTPLIARTLHGANVLLKCEWFMPTGSFKDRGASVMLSLLRDQGIKNVLEDSSGNGGAAVSAYAAAGGMSATIMAPASTSPAKTVQMRAHGAQVKLIPGTRQDTADAAIAAAGEEKFYASHNWHPFFLHGTKTLAYELWEDLGFAAPDNVIMPCGAGSNVLGCEIGFSELFRAEQIEKLPRLFAVQPENCGPIAAAFLTGDTDAQARIEPTIAEGTAIGQPIRLREVLGALRETQGGAVTLTEAEIAESTLDLARMGFYVEPTAAQAAGALKKLLASGAIAPGEKTVLVLTGSGLKATPRIAELLGMTL